MKIRCCGCGHDVEARLTNGKEVYPHRPDLFSLPFWKCDVCGNFVGCHHKTANRTRPSGCIPTPEIKRIRMQIHALIDPIWKSGRMSRSKLYLMLSKKIGWEYHTAKIKTAEEGERVLKIAEGLLK